MSMDCRTLPRPAMIGRLFTTDKDGASSDGHLTQEARLMTFDLRVLCSVSISSQLHIASDYWTIDYEI